MSKTDLDERQNNTSEDDIWEKQVMELLDSEELELMEWASAIPDVTPPRPAPRPEPEPEPDPGFFTVVVDPAKPAPPVKASPKPSAPPSDIVDKLLSDLPLPESETAPEPTPDDPSFLYVPVRSGRNDGPHEPARRIRLDGETEALELHLNIPGLSEDDAADAVSAVADEAPDKPAAEPSPVPAEDRKRSALSDEQQREKRRAWNERRWSVMTVALLCVFFVLVILFVTVFPRSTVSNIENRTLAKFPAFSLPAYFSGSFTSGVTTWYDDTVPYRDSFKNMGNVFRSHLGVTTENTITFINQDVVANAANAVVDGDETAEDAAPPVETTEAVPAQTAEAAEGTPEVAEESPAAQESLPEPTPEPEKGRDYRTEDAEFDTTSNALMLVFQDGHWRCMPLFGGGSEASFVNGLNALRERLDDSVRIYAMPAPLSSQFYLPSNAAGYSEDQDTRFDSIGAQLDEGITFLNICPIEQSHSEEPIYLRTDHHWAPLGAYYAARALTEAAGVPVVDLNDYDERVNEGYVGTMYAFTDDSRLLYDPEDFVYYVPINDNYSTYYYDRSFNYQYQMPLIIDTDVSNSYLMFMGGDDKIVKITTDVKNGRRLLVSKDSYGNAEIPFYVGSFEEVYVTDMRYFNRNLVSFINDLGITDVLFTCCSYSVVGVNADGLMTLITQNEGETVVDEQAAEAAAETQAAAEEARDAAAASITSFFSATSIPDSQT